MGICVSTTQVYQILRFQYFNIFLYDSFTPCLFSPALHFWDLSMSTHVALVHFF